VSGLTYDTGALVAGENNNRKLWALHRRALERGVRPTIPAGVLAQAWRGGPQAELSRLVKGCRIEVLNEVRGRAAGQACGRSNTADVIDAAVAVGAIVRGDLVVTSAVKDIRHLASSLDATLEIVPI